MITQFKAGMAVYDAGESAFCTGLCADLPPRHANFMGRAGGTTTSLAKWPVGSHLLAWEQFNRERRKVDGN